MTCYARRQGAIHILFALILAVMVGVLLLVATQFNKIREENEHLLAELESAAKTSAREEVRPSGTQRALSAETMVAFKRALTRIPRLAVQLEHAAGDAEAFALAEQIEGIFHEAGWPVARALSACSPPAKGLSIVYQEEPEEAARKTFKLLFDSFGYEEAFEVDSSISPDSMVLTVGTK